MSDVKERAIAFRVGLNAGYVMPDEVIAWADDLIGAGDVPEPELIEVSLVVGKPAGELAQALSAARGEVC